MEKRKGIILDENFRIEPDAYNYTLFFEKEGEINPKTGKPTKTESQWYPPTLQDALRSYVREKARIEVMGQEHDLKSVLEILKRIEDEISKIN